MRTPADGSPDEGRHQEQAEQRYNSAIDRLGGSRSHHLGQAADLENPEWAETNGQNPEPGRTSPDAGVHRACDSCLLGNVEDGGSSSGTAGEEQRHGKLRCHRERDQEDAEEAYRPGDPANGPPRMPAPDEDD